MANKQYISIMRLFEHCSIATNDAFNLQRAKKQLQAEFSVSPSGFIEVDGYAYSRNDVFEELDNPDFVNRLVFHKQLWSSPQILKLLENNAADFATISNEFTPLWSNRKFDEFFSPYFQGPFSYISRILLSGMHFHEISALLAYQDFLLPAEREEAFRPVRVFFDENVKLLRNTNGQNYRVMRQKIGQWIYKDWHTFFNSLPAEFDDTKNQIVTSLINISVAIQKNFRRDCRKMSGQLILLTDTPGSLRSIIISNHAVYSKSRFSYKGRNVFWGIWGFVALIRLVLGKDACNTNSDNLNFNQYNTTKYQLLDTSLLKTLKDSINAHHDSIGNIMKQYQE